MRSQRPLPQRATSVLGAGCLIALNLRWFLPAEDAVNGATLWLATFWCLAALLASFLAIPRDEISRRWTRADAAVSLLIGGHVLGGLLVLIQGGQRQLAANLLGEWLGMAALWMTVREFVRLPAFRKALWQSTLMSLTAIAILGCWQHWVELPGMTHRLGPKFDAVRAARAVGGTDPAEQELSHEGVPLTEPEFTLFEKRLRDSREPFGFFALANTLGGFLAAGLMLLLGHQFLPSDRREASPHHRSSWQRGILIAAALPLGLCLLLTKSRTALLSVFLVGGFVAGFRVWRSRFPRTRWGRWIGLTAAILLLATALIGLLSRSGSWDREILTEAAKSLSYRVYYWTGTAQLIAEQPVQGGGLGQFRNAYLRVKNPAASEEIADPHNALLDVWFNGGLLALAGALWLMATFVVTTWKAATSNTISTEESASDFSWSLAGSLAPWAGFGVLYFGHGIWDDRLLIIGLVLGGWPLVISSGTMTHPVTTQTACGLSALVLWTHLMGAGGIAYPAVTQFLFLLLVGTFSTAREADDSVRSGKIVWVQRGLLAATAVMVIFLWNPAQRGKLESADALAARGAPSALVREAYAEAKSGNPWDPIPCSRLAELAFRDLQAADRESIRGGPHADPENFAAVTREMLSAAERDPKNGQWWHRLGEMSLAWHKRHPSSELAQQARTFFIHAVERYPTNARWQADLSDAAAAAGDAPLAAQSAQAAIMQDDINQRFGHAERILAAEVRQRLESRRSSASFPPE